MITYYIIVYINIPTQTASHHNIAHHIITLLIINKHIVACRRGQAALSLVKPTARSITEPLPKSEAPDLAEQNAELARQLVDYYTML